MTMALSQVSGPHNAAGPPLWKSPDLSHRLVLSCEHHRLVSSLLTPVSVAAVQCRGEDGGGGHQSTADIDTHQLPLLHPGHAGDEDLQ